MPLAAFVIGALDDGAFLGALGLGNGVGVVPEVVAAHVAVVQPQADVVRVVGALVCREARAGSRA